MKNAMKAVKDNFATTQAGQAFNALAEKTVSQRIAALSSNGPTAAPKQGPSA